MGTWEGRRRCDGTRSGLRYEVWKDSLLLYLRIRGSFYAEKEETLQMRILDPYQLYFPPQILRDTPLWLSGYAERRRDSLFFVLQVQGGIHQVDTCLWDLKRR
ncbi:MAG: hypothetical protein RMK19_08120 [Bacteroidia bacterium]|nr:hypothetical protein [Bacteroidia bacterium]MDW8015962.1 hypothetical protein [Bacteroidia bacterium]